MERRLDEAAAEGDVIILLRLLREDPLVLHKAALKCEDKNPLHVAAMLGNVDIVRAILNDHSAYLLCLARDRDGRNPLQLAAICGRLGVLVELIATGKQAALEKTDGGGTILHLCIKYNQLEALKLLVDRLNDPEYLNAKNEDGMTILHLAINYEKEETIIYLIEEARVGVNIRNAKGETALDLLLAQGKISPRIQSSLHKSKALKGRIARFIDEDPKGKQRNLQDLLHDSKDAIMIVASLIATMAFQVAVNPPGGMWQDNLLEGPNPHRAGEAIIAQTHLKYYRQLIRASTTAFVSSLATIISILSQSGIRSFWMMVLLSLVMAVAVISLALTYAISLIMVAPKHTRGGFLLSDAGVIVLIVVLTWSWLAFRPLFKLISSINEKFLKFTFALPEKLSQDANTDP